MIALYAATIFLSAALLFTVQPMFTRLVLPLLGGSPGAWNTALVFFQVTLLAGYGYAHLTTRALGIRRQAFVHVAAMLLPLLALPLALPRASTPPAGVSPVPWLLSTMLITVGPPFFAISAGGPLLQRWFSATGHPRAADPYFLYAASNLGSMLALLAYPAVLEPLLRLHTQAAVWAWLYGALVILMAACAACVRRSTPASPVDPPARGAPGRLRILRWIGLAFVPSCLLMGTTTYLTTDVASAPLLWIIPLAIYLLTFILAFLEPSPIPHPPLVRAASILLAAGVVAAAAPIKGPTWLLLGLLVSVFFGVSMVCHRELAKDRPAPAHLTGFFLWISVGGALGGAFCALLAPILFRSVIEYSLALALAAFLLPAAPGESGPRLADAAFAAAILGLTVALVLARRAGLLAGATLAPLGFAIPALVAFRASSRPFRFGLSLGAVLLVGHLAQIREEGVLFQDRSFFGALKVIEANQSPLGLPGFAGSPRRSLLHGRTLHGVQAVSPAERGEPLSYYSPEGPIGQVFLEGPIRSDAKIAVVGLGVGSLIAYAQPDQAWTFFEIDPIVAAIARTPAYFTYLADARAPYSIELGDARISLGRSAARFSLIVLDAYSSDAVPIHLLTREAMELYVARLEEGGVIALHISNRYLDLLPVVAGIGEALGLVGLVRDDRVNFPAMAKGKAPSRWALLARRVEDFGRLAGDPRWIAPPPGLVRVVWTDDFSSLVDVLRR